MWFADPRVSSAPHFDGQRSAALGTFQDCAWTAELGVKHARITRQRIVRVIQISSGC
jgi:hypothetical protein